MKNEPLFSVAGITAAATAVLAVLVAFGLNLAEAQSTAVLGLVAVAAPFAVAWVSRGKVTPNAKVPPTE